jgi:hypothetical protein
MPKTELEDQEVLDLGDDGESGDNLDNRDEYTNTDDTDRGDDFVDPDAPAGEADGGEPDTSGSGKEGAGKDGSADGEGDREGNTGNIPASRLGEVARAKTAAVAIGKGLVDGTVDKTIIDDLGGYDAVVKAVANKELSVADLQSVEGREGRKQDATPAPVQGVMPNIPGLEEREAKIVTMYVEYHELVDAGEVLEASTKLREIGKEERGLERDVEAIQQAQAAAKREEALVNDYIQKELFVKHPVLRDHNSTEHDDVLTWADKYQARFGYDRITALKEALVKVGLEKPDNSNDEGETAQQKTLRLRKEAELRRSAGASISQPPPMGLGASPKSEATPDVAKMSEERFAAMTPEEKARARGDFL